MSWQVGLYAAAVLIPLAAFTVEAIFIRQLKRFNAYLATGAIGLSCLLSLVGFVDYSIESGFYAHTTEAGEGAAEPGAAGEQTDGAHEPAHHQPLVWSGSSVDWVILGAAAATGRLAEPDWSFRWESRSTI